MLTRPTRFTVLLVLGDGRRVVRLNVPRVLSVAASAVLLLGGATLAAVWSDYLSLSARRGELAVLRQQSAEQGRLLDAVGRQIAAMQAEVGGWRDLHGSIWEPLGPRAPRAGGTDGIGGGSGAAADVEAPGSDLTAQLERLAVDVRDEGEQLRALARVMSRAGKVLAALPSRWPVRGPVNSEFGRRRSPWSGAPESHRGIDIAARVGAPVKAPAPGVVVLAGALGEYGRTVEIDHGHEIRTRYAHLHKIHVAVGQKVERGQQIATAGNTGKSSGPHLHYEITVRGRPVDPRAYLWD